MVNFLSSKYSCFYICRRNKTSPQNRSMGKTIKTYNTKASRRVAFLPHHGKALQQTSPPPTAVIQSRGMEKPGVSYIKQF